MLKKLTISLLLLTGCTEHYNPNMSFEERMQNPQKYIYQGYGEVNGVNTYVKYGFTQENNGNVWGDADTDRIKIDEAENKDQDFYIKDGKPYWRIGSTGCPDSYPRPSHYLPNAPKEAKVITKTKAMPDGGKLKVFDHEKYKMLEKRYEDNVDGRSEFNQKLWQDCTTLIGTFYLSTGDVYFCDTDLNVYKGVDAFVAAENLENVVRKPIDERNTKYWKARSELEEQLKQQLSSVFEKAENDIR